MLKWFSPINLGLVLTQIYSDIFTLSDAIDDSIDSLDTRISSVENNSIASRVENGMLIFGSSSSNSGGEG